MAKREEKTPAVLRSALAVINLVVHSCHMAIFASVASSFHASDGVGMPQVNTRQKALFLPAVVM